MGQLVQALEWDTEFFGVPIARVYLQGADEARLSAIDAEARDEGVACSYGSLDPEDLATSVLAQQFGHRLVDVAVTLSRPAGPFEPPPSRSKVREGTMDDLRRLSDAIHPLGPWSRFGADPRFGPDAARRMFRAWVERAVTDQDRMLSIAEDEDGITGLAAHVRGAPDRIDLISVVKPATGAADAMMACFLEWARAGPVEAGPSAARNVAVLRFWERCGFRVSRCRYHFHRWFDEDQADSR